MESKNFFSNLMTLFVIVALFVTNPTHKDHKDGINRNFKSKNPITGTFGGGRALGGLTQYQDCLFFSVTMIEGEPMSIGVMGKVIVLQDLDIKVNP